MQYLVFPEGMMHNKKTDEVLTPRVNSLFGEIALLSNSSAKNKKGDLLQVLLFGSHVDLKFS